MIQKIFSVFDEKAQVFNAPFFTNNDAVATRMMRQTLADKNTSLAQYPGDFVLYSLGLFDPASGQIEPQTPEQILRLSALLEDPPHG